MKIYDYCSSKQYLSKSPNNNKDTTRLAENFTVVRHKS